MIASLPMYWRAGNAALWRAFWGQVQGCAAREGVALPDLTPPEDIPEPWTDHWLRPDLALSMTCGLPFRSALRGKVTYVGTLDFGLDVPAGQYVSHLLARAGTARADPGDAVLAYNAADSQSGWAVAQPWLEPGTRFLRTGAHAASARAVLTGAADFAFVDAVTWRILTRSDQELARLDIVATTAPSPGLPLITALGTDPEPLRRALRDAVQAFAPEDPLSMGGPMTFHVLDVADYLALPIPAPPPAA